MSRINAPVPLAEWLYDHLGDSGLELFDHEPLLAVVGAVKRIEKDRGGQQSVPADVVQGWLELVTVKRRELDQAEWVAIDQALHDGFSEEQVKAALMLNNDVDLRLRIETLRHRYHGDRMIDP